MNNDLLRMLPKMDLLIEDNYIKRLIKEFNRELVISSLRDSLNFYRESIIKGRINREIKAKEIIERAILTLNKKRESSLKTVINCTGIVIHTNLGRGILSDGAIEAMVEVAKNYNNLEFDIKKGTRGSRNSHISSILKELTKAEDAIVVNNNAAAIMLVLNELAKDREVIVSRGELVEIGGSFRVPEIMEMSGSYLKEVGTTNRTDLKDYERAISEKTAMVLKVHSSNFKMIGFTKEVTAKELATLAKEKKLLSVFDLGSGFLTKLDNLDIDEKTVAEVIESGIDIVTFSGDKLLGGPQAGIIAGKGKYIDKIKSNPLMRALRVDKLTLAALEGTLIEYLDKEKVFSKIPTLKMLSLKEEDLKKKAEDLLKLLKPIKEFNCIIERDYSLVGGGSMPGEKLDSYVIKIDSKILLPYEIERAFREYKKPIITRINKDRVIIDLRTVKEEHYEIIAEALKEMAKR